MREMIQDQTRAEVQTAKESLRRNRAITLSLVTSLMFLLLTASFMPDLLSSETPNYWSFAISIPITIVGLVCAILAWRNRTTTAAGILLGTILILSLVSPIVGRGQGVSIGILVVILGIGIATNTFPPNLINRAIWISILTGVAVIIIDLFIPDFGLESNAAYTNISAIVLFIVFLILGARRFNTFTLQAKLVISFALVMLLPLLILGIYNNNVARSTLTEESRSQLTNLSDQARQDFDSFFIDQLNQIRTEAKQVPLIDYLLLPSSLRGGSAELERANQTLATFQRKDPVFIVSYAILDPNGRNILSTNAEDIAKNESKELYFTAIATDGLPSYVSNVKFINGTDGRIFFSAPIKDNLGNNIGVLRVEYYATILQSLARALAPADAGINITVVDRNTFIRLAYSEDRDELFKTYKSYSEMELAALQAGGRVPQLDKNELLANVDQDVMDGINSLESQAFFEAYSPTFQSQTTNTGSYLETQPWVLLVQESVAKNQEALKIQTRNIIFISLALAALAITLAFGAAQVIAAPLVSLTRVAEKISKGDTTARAQITTEDEVGALSESFNNMTEELNRSLASLEERVSERTTDLEISRQQSEKRANELLAIGDISRLISSEQKFENLLPLITRLVSERFNFYHVGIFLLDETKQFAVLQASNSAGGKKLIESGHKLEVGGSGIVGYVAKHSSARIALDVGLDAVFFNNPNLPETRSEMGLPLIVRNQILGVLDVQSTKPGAFTESDISTLGILADQIAIAIENTRLFEQSQKALNEFQSLYRQNIREGWAAFSQEETLLGYHQTMAGGKKISKPVETNEIRTAINRGDILVAQPKNELDTSFIVMPVKLRGQIIGTLKVEAPTRNRAWTKDEINLAGAVSERLSLALENARLIEESQKRAIKEQTITEVTSKIGASIDLKSVLQTAVEELGRALPGSEVLIRFDSNGTKQE
jgi:GAF domain-containing protein/HAMP domain-containing protein/cytochrome c oxidase subunit IV